MSVRHGALRGVFATTLALGLVLPALSARGQTFTPSRCGVAQAHTHGCLATIVKGPGTSEGATEPVKQGRACAWNLLSLVAIGDVRVSTAQLSSHGVRPRHS